MGMAAATADTQANGDLPFSALLCSFGHPCVRPVHLPLICNQETYMNSEKQSGLRQKIGSRKHHLKLNNINYLLHYGTQSMPGQLQSHFTSTYNTAEGFNLT